MRRSKFQNDLNGLASGALQADGIVGLSDSDFLLAPAKSDDAELNAHAVAMAESRLESQWTAPRNVAGAPNRPAAAFKQKKPPAKVASAFKKGQVEDFLLMIERKHAVDMWAAIKRTCTLENDPHDTVRKYLEDGCGLREATILPGHPIPATESTLTDVRLTEMRQMFDVEEVKKTQGGWHCLCGKTHHEPRCPRFVSAFKAMKANLAVIESINPRSRSSSQTAKVLNAPLRPLLMQQLQELVIEESHSRSTNGGSVHPVPRDVLGVGYHLKPAKGNADQWSGLICNVHLPRPTGNGPNGCFRCVAPICNLQFSLERDLCGSIQEGTPKAAMVPLPWPWKLRCDGTGSSIAKLRDRLYFQEIQGPRGNGSISPRCFFGSSFLPSPHLCRIPTEEVWHYVSLKPLDETKTAVSIWGTYQASDEFWPNVLNANARLDATSRTHNPIHQLETAVSNQLKHVETHRQARLDLNMSIRTRSRTKKLALEIADEVVDCGENDASGVNRQGTVSNDHNDRFTSEMGKLLHCKMMDAIAHLEQERGREFKSVDWFCVLPQNNHGPWEEMAGAMVEAELLPTKESASSNYVTYHYQEGKLCPPDHYQRMIVPATKTSDSKDSKGHKIYWRDRFKELKERDIGADPDQLHIIICTFSAVKNDQEEAKKFVREFLKPEGWPIRLKDEVGVGQQEGDRVTRRKQAEEMLKGKKAGTYLVSSAKDASQDEDEYLLHVLGEDRKTVVCHTFNAPKDVAATLLTTSTSGFDDDDDEGEQDKRLDLQTTAMGMPAVIEMLKCNTRIPNPKYPNVMCIYTSSNALPGREEQTVDLNDAECVVGKQVLRLALSCGQ